MDPSALREYAARERRAPAALKSEHWRERKERLGPAESLRVADELRRWYVRRQPGWPSPAERDADLAMHVEVGESLRSLARR